MGANSLSIEQGGCASASRKCQVKTKGPVSLVPLKYEAGCPTAHPNWEFPNSLTSWTKGPASVSYNPVLCWVEDYSANGQRHFGAVNKLHCFNFCLYEIRSFIPIYCRVTFFDVLKLMLLLLRWRCRDIISACAERFIAIKLMKSTLTRVVQESIQLLGGCLVVFFPLVILPSQLICHTSGSWLWNPKMIYAFPKINNKTSQIQ